MMSNLSLSTNYINAQKSTGPRTQRGKARSSQNARKHGIRSPISSDQRWHLEFIDLCAALRDEFPEPKVATFPNELAYALIDINRISEAMLNQFEASFQDLAAGLPMNLQQLLDRLERLKRYEQRAHFRLAKIFERVFPGSGPPPSRKQALPRF